MSQVYTGSFTQMLLGLLPESTEQRNGSKSIVKPILKVLSLFWFVFFK